MSYNQRRRGGGQARPYDSQRKFEQGGRRFTPRSSYSPRNENQPHSNSLQVWMGDLDPKWDENEILRLWRDTGMSPVSVKIMRDRHNDSARPVFCFVTFNTAEEASSALQKNATPIPGTNKMFKLSHATGAPNSDGMKKKFDDFSIFVGDLDQDMKESQLFDLFSAKYPNAIRQVKIMMDVTTNTSKGYGFVRFSSSAAQQTALRDKEIMYKGKIIKVGPTNNSSGPTFTKEESVADVSYDHIELAQVQPPLNHYTDPHNTWIRVQGLAGRFSREMIMSHFGSFGTIVSCVCDADFNVWHIRYLLRSQAETAVVLMSNVLINGCILDVNWAPPREDGVHKLKTHKDGSLQPVPLVYGSRLHHLDGVSQAQATEFFGSLYEESEPNQAQIDARYVCQQLEAFKAMT